MDALVKALGLGNLHQAVFAGDLKRVKELLRQGEDINRQTAVNKMTALHISIIIRKFRITCLLLRKGASLSVQDQNGRTPARYNHRKIRGRYLALFKKFGYRHEDDVGREIITIPLPTPTDTDDSTYGYIAGPKDTLPTAAAISGWAHGDTVFKAGLLPNGTFTELVRKTANFLKFHLPEQGFLDSGRSHCPEINAANSGRHLGSHVEKQLGLVWVLLLLLKYFTTNNLDRLRGLKDVQLEEDESKAWIFLNHDPCANCLGFLTRLEETTGVSFAVKTVPTVANRERRNGTRKQPVSQAVAAPRQDTSFEEDNVTNIELQPMREALIQTPPQRSKFKSAPNPIEYTSPPVPWTRWGPTIAKPAGHKVGKAEYHMATSSAIVSESSQPASRASEVVPASTITGADGNRSAFFESPQAPRTRNVPKTKLDLDHFKYRRTPAPTSPIVKKPNRGHPRGSKNKQPSRSTVRKQATMREKSTFANAVRFHQQKRRQLSNNTRARIQGPLNNTLAGSIRSSERICRDTRRYFEEHFGKGTLPDEIKPRRCSHGIEMPHYL
ncbi:hypothetical protein V8F06_001142 [Rhypophila decipiens]